ncbi:hypothetical protein D3C72_2417720 [compost metagenome]
MQWGIEKLDDDIESEHVCYQGWLDRVCGADLQKLAALETQGGIVIGQNTNRKDDIDGMGELYLCSGRIPKYECVGIL